MPSPAPVRRRNRTRLALELLEARELLSGYAPTQAEQLFLEELNDARANPAAYGSSVGLDLSSVAPSQPLAFNPAMIQASSLHSKDMNDSGYFAHVSPTAGDVGQRLSAAGVAWTSYGESIAGGQAYVQPADALQALIVDAGVPSLGHRYQLLSIGSAYQTIGQVGIGIVQGGSGPLSNYYTIDSAATADNRPFLTGVVFSDVNHNGKYDPGEGLAGVTVSVSGGPVSQTWDTGGYSIQVNPGTYVVTASGGGLASAVTRTVTVGSSNVRVNFLPSGGSGPAATLPGASWFTVSTDHGLWEYRDHSGWTRIGNPGSIQSVSTVTDGIGQLVAFAITTVHGLYRYDDGNGWLKLGEAGTINTVSAGTDVVGHANVFALTMDGSFFEHNDQAGWLQLGAPGTVTSVSAGSAERVYVTGADGTVLQHDARGGWARLTSPGFARSLSVATEGSGNMVLFAVTRDQALYEHGDQTGWIKLGDPHTVQAVEAGVDASGQAQACLTATDGTVYEFSRASWARLDGPGAVRSVIGSAPGLFYTVMADNSVFRHDDHWGWCRLTGSGFGLD